MTCRLDMSRACWRAPPRSTGLAVDTSAPRACPWHRMSSVWVQLPSSGLQVSMVQGLPSSQLTGVPGRHAPVVGSQVSTPLPALPSLHTTGTPTQDPAAQAYPPAPASPSSQLALLFTYTPPSCESQTS